MGKWWVEGENEMEREKGDWAEGNRRVCPSEIQAGFASWLFILHVHNGRLA